MDSAPEELTLEQLEALDENTPSDRLQKLASQSPEIATLVARNPNANASLLEKLASEGNVAICQNLVANPNIPSHLLIDLAPWLLRYCFQNPAIDLLLLENPPLLAQEVIDLLCGSLQRNIAPVPLEYAARSSNEQLQLALAMNPQASVAHLQTLVGSRSEVVREAAKMHVNWSQTSEAIEDVQTLVQNILAEKHESFEESLSRVCGISSLNSYIPNYLEDISPSLRWYFPDYSVEELEGYAESPHYHEVRRAAANPNTPASILEKVFERGEPLANRDLAINPATPVHILEHLAEKNNLSNLVALNTSTPPYLLEKLLTSRSKSQLYRNIAINPKTPPQLLEKLAAKSRLRVDVCQAIARNSHTPVNVLEQLASHHDLLVLATVAINQNTPPDLAKRVRESLDIRRFMPLKRYAKREQAREIISNLPISPTDLVLSIEGTRRGWLVGTIALHGNLPAPVLKKLLESRDIKVASAAAANPLVHTYIEEMWGIELLDTLNYSVLMSLASNLNASPKVLGKILHSQDRLLCARAARNPCINPHLLNAWGRIDRMDDLMDSEPTTNLRYWISRSLKLASSLDSIVYLEQQTLEEWESQIPHSSRLRILLNPQTPAKILAEIAHTRIWLERWAIAGNPTTPKPILEKLTQDANRIVRKRALAQLSAGITNFKQSTT